MTAYNFKVQFADDVESGRKTQTIRAYRKDGRTPSPGGTLQLFTGQRTNNCRKLRDATCISIQHIYINHYGGSLPIVKLDKQRLAPAQVADLATADGFNRVMEMLDFFRANHGLPFRGLLIKWV